MFIDTHTHIYLEKFDEDRPTCIENAIQSGVDRMYLPNIDSKSIPQVQKTVKEYPDYCIPMMGLHPCSVKADYIKELNIIHQEAKARSYVAIGEIGLDYYWSKDFIEEQKIAFRTQIEWAIEMSLPIVIHSRDSIDDCISIVREYAHTNLTGIFHCFTGTRDQANAIIELNFLMGVGGVLTFKNAGLDKVIADVSLEHLVLETDAPYLAPHPHRGKRNESKFVPLIAQKLAEVQSIEVEEVARITTQNSISLFEKE